MKKTEWLLRIVLTLSGGLIYFSAWFIALPCLGVAWFVIEGMKKSEVNPNSHLEAELNGLKSQMLTIQARIGITRYTK